jgi:hypothetical protein
MTREWGLLVSDQDILDLVGTCNAHTLYPLAARFVRVIDAIETRVPQARRHVWSLSQRFLRNLAVQHPQGHRNNAVDSLDPHSISPRNMPSALHYLNVYQCLGEEFASTGRRTQMNENRSEPKLLSILLNPIKLLAPGRLQRPLPGPEPKPFSTLHHLRETVNTEVEGGMYGVALE